MRMCHLLGIPRSLVYRKVPAESARLRFYRELKLEIASVLHIHPGYGYRRVRRELGRGAFACGYRSVSRAMREAGFQRRRRRTTPRTSDGKGVGKYPNLLKGARICAPGQAWVVDITYIGLPHGFAYLACVLDVFARKIVGSAMSSRIDSQLTVRALRNALESSPPESQWIHHSDGGSQYLCDSYTKLALESGARLSLSQKGRPQDNAFIESFYKTLKAEEVWLENYQNINEARESITGFIDYYNSKRMHSSLGYISPDEYLQRSKENDLR